MGEVKSAYAEVIERVAARIATMADDSEVVCALRAESGGRFEVESSMIADARDEMAHIARGAGRQTVWARALQPGMCIDDGGVAVTVVSNVEDDDGQMVVERLHDGGRYVLRYADGARYALRGVQRDAFELARRVWAVGVVRFVDRVDGGRFDRDVPPALQVLASRTLHAMAGVIVERGLTCPNDWYKTTEHQAEAARRAADYPEADEAASMPGLWRRPGLGERSAYEMMHTLGDMAFRTVR